MKVALLVNKGNYEKYAEWNETGWELVHMGNGKPNIEKIIATKADVLVVDAVMPIGPDIIKNMPQLKLIHSQGVAYNAIDFVAAGSKGIYVCNNAGVNAQAVAEQSILLILSLLRGFRQNEDMMYAGKQIEAKTECFENGITELGSCRVGIVGYGAIGKALAERLRPFGCELVCHTRSGKSGEPDIPHIPLHELYSQCDIISLHVPVTPDTENMINGETLELFKRGSILINTARGELIDHDTIVRALISGKLGGFGADTLAPEPVTADNPLLRALPYELRAKVALSPHIAGITAGCFKRVYEHIKKNIEAIERGERPDCIANGLQ